MLKFYSDEIVCNDQKIKGSFFKVLSYKIENLNDFKSLLNDQEEKFSDASHICYAYRYCNINQLDLFYNPEVVEYSSDDGEPSGTAGKPILNTLRNKNIVNRVIFVIRYFGGTKLGIPGLIEAYKSSSELVTNILQLKKWVFYKRLILKTNYSFYKILEDLILNYEGNIHKSNFLEEIELDIYIPYKHYSLFKKKIIDKSKGTIIILE